MLAAAMNPKLRAMVLGATGVAGQQFVAALTDHPWFTVTRLCASERSAGRSFGEALRDERGSLRWYAGGRPPPDVLELPVWAAKDATTEGIDVVFSAVESDVAKELEPRMAAAVPVFSTASAFRYEPDVPILLPGVNRDHARLLRTQQLRRGFRGFIAPGPNCTTVGLAITLAPILRHFGLRKVVMTSLQSVSGAGRSPGVAALDVIDNIIPFIPGEEEKVERETRKILGLCAGGSVHEHAIESLPVAVSCTCTRVAVLDGHTEAVFCETERAAPLSEVKAALEEFGRELTALRLPSLPPQLISVTDDPYRPQPRLDRDLGSGLTTVVGRLRDERALGEHGVKYVLLSHNTKMGAAQGAILTAEQLLVDGYFP